MSDMILKTLETKLSAEPGERAVVARISTVDVDRDGDVMLPSGMDAKDFNKNPIVLMQHRRDMPPVGRAVDIKTTTKHINAKVIFPERPLWLEKAAPWPPDDTFALFQAKLLNAFSIGFLIDDEREATQKDIDTFGKGARRVISKWKLMEFSAVSIPSNQNALVTAVSATKSWIRGLWVPDVPDPVIEFAECEEMELGVTELDIA